jgi:hypothetical protein
MAAVQASGGAAERATTLGGPQQTLREATAAVDGDWETGAPLSTARSSCALVGESLEFVLSASWLRLSNRSCTPLSP